MLDPIIQLVTSIDTALRGPLFLVLMGTALAICGYYFMFGNHDRARDRTMWTLIGGTVLLGSYKVVTALQGAIK